MARPVRILLHRVMLLADNTRLVGRTGHRALTHRSPASGLFLFLMGGCAIDSMRRRSGAKPCVLVFRVYRPPRERTAHFTPSTF
jgi:hypothetical protein